jgi:hypothetical protein
LEELWRLDAPERPVTAADVAADKAVLLERMRTDDRRRDLERVYALVPIPDRMPAYSKLLIDDLGWVWVEEYYAAGDQRRTYVVLSPDGRPAARLALPSELNAYQIGADFVLGTWVDEATDIEYVRQYSLNRAEDS